MPIMACNLTTATTPDELYDFHIYKGAMSIADSESQLNGLARRRKSHLHKLDAFRKQQGGVKDYKEAVFSARDADLEMWLQQFGYLGADNTNLLQHYHTVDGLLIPLISQLKLCNSCALGKHSAYSYRMSEIRRASEALKLGHTEVNGRVTEVFFERALYRMLLMYDFSRYFSFYLLKYGSDAWRCLAAFRSFAERRPGQLLKHVRSEHGGSFISKAFGQYRLWERVEECVVESRDVVFNESSGGIIGTADADRLNAPNGANEVFAPDVPAPPSSLASISAVAHYSAPTGRGERRRS